MEEPQYLPLSSSWTGKNPSGAIVLAYHCAVLLYTGNCTKKDEFSNTQVSAGGAAYRELKGAVGVIPRSACNRTVSGHIDNVLSKAMRRTKVSFHVVHSRHVKPVYAGADDDIRNGRAG